MCQQCSAPLRQTRCCCCGICIVWLASKGAPCTPVYDQRSCALQDELPERLLGTCRLEHLDLSMAAHLDTETGVITRKALG